MGNENKKDKSKPAKQTMSDSFQGLIRYVKTGIDVKTTGTTTVCTTDSGRRFHPLFVIFEMTAASSLTVGATLSLGVTAAAYADIVAAVVIGTAANKMLPNAITALVDSIPASTDVKVNVSVAAVGTSGTARVDLLGYYE